MRELNALDGVWAGHIQAPDQKAHRYDRFTIHQSVFVRSLRPLLDMPIMARIKPAQIALLLNSYWGGIAKVLPEPFDPVNNPGNYVIQKSQGAAILHDVLPQVIEVVPAQGKSLADRMAYAEVMHDLPTLSGEIMTEHGTEPVSGAKFWLSGPAGVASQFSGEAGRRHLSTQVQALIPRPAEGLEIEHHRNVRHRGI
ncbi:MAG: hypothetical protein ACRDRV_14555 [Pseudonocardiaceae bacterium]